METRNKETDKILTNLRSLSYLYIVASIMIFSVLLSKFFSFIFQQNTRQFKTAGLSYNASENCSRMSFYSVKH